jgi:hypothetical protein
MVSLPTPTISQDYLLNQPNTLIPGIHHTFATLFYSSSQFLLQVLLLLILQYIHFSVPVSPPDSVSTPYSSVSFPSDLLLFLSINVSTLTCSFSVSFLILHILHLILSLFLFLLIVSIPFDTSLCFLTLFLLALILPTLLLKATPVTTSSVLFCFYFF